jgi:hypothetical protein
MDTMRINNRVALATLVSIFYFNVLLFSVMAFAQSSSDSPQPVVSLPAYMTSGPVPGANVEGYVYDEDGKPIPNANISLWLDGQLWQPTTDILNGRGNPQTTNLPNQVTAGYLMEGSYQFGMLYPGNYTLIVEKSVYRSKPVYFHIGNDTLMETPLSAGPSPTVINITLTGYHVPTFTPKQLSYSGSIAGSLHTIYGQHSLQANVSLWQDGRMVDTPDNPQASIERNYNGMTIDYIFKHLAPGNYTVKAEYYGPSPADTISVDVGTGTVRADILSNMVLPVTPQPTTEVASPSADVKPTPILSGLLTLLVTGFVLYYLANKK